MTMRILLFLIGLASVAVGSDVDVHLKKFPERRVAPVVIDALTAGGLPGGDGITIIPGEAVILAGEIAQEIGPPDGLEKIACLWFGKTGESLIRLDSRDGIGIASAFLAAFAPPPGLPAIPEQKLPARGMAVSLTIEWQDRDGTCWRIPATCLVRDRILDAPYPPLPFPYTGSSFRSDGRGGEIFEFDACGTLAASFDEDDALLSSPFPDPLTDERYEVNTAWAPKATTRVQVICRPVKGLPRLFADDEGQLRMSVNEVPLDDVALGAFIAQHKSQEWAAVEVDSAADRSFDPLIRERILAVAAHKGLWMTPHFLNHIP